MAMATPPEELEVVWQASVSEVVEQKSDGN